MQEHYPSAEAPRRGWRPAKLLACSVALTLSAFGTLAAVTTLPAFAAVGVTTNPYTIGAPGAGLASVTVTPTSVTSNESASFEVKFVTPVALSNSTPDSVTVTSSVAFGTATWTSIELIDDTASTCFQSVTPVASPAATDTSFTVDVPANCSFAADNTVEVDFTNAKAPTSNFTLSANTDLNGSVASGTITSSSVPPTLADEYSTVGSNTVFTISDVGASNATEPWTTLTAPVAGPLNAIQLTGTSGDISFYSGGAGGYTVTVTPLNGTATADTVSSAPIGATSNIVDLVLGTDLASGDTVNITADGQNGAASTTGDVEILAGNYTGTTFTAASAPASFETTNAITIGSAVSAVSLSVSPQIANASATYVANFKATTQVCGAATNGCAVANPDAAIFFSEPDTNFSGETGVLVADNSSTNSFHFVATLVAADFGTGVTNAATDTLTSPGAGAEGAVMIPLAGYTINSGDPVTVTMISVTNPSSNGTYSDFTVYTDEDSVGLAAPAYTIGVSGTTGVPVSLSSSAASATGVTYTISNFYATAANLGGTQTIPLTAPGGTLLPDATTYYTLTDVTTPAASGTVAAVGSWGGNTITLTVPNGNIAEGDLLLLTITDVQNPGAASSSDSINLANADLGYGSSVAAFPHANLTYPNGAIVNYSGTFYVFAGGHAFGITSPKVLLALEAVDHATVQKAATGATPPTSVKPRAGTVMFTSPIDGNPTIYVMGTDGDLHGFSSPSQFTADGFDPALVVTVPNWAGLTVGSTAGVAGSAVSAFATAADGAIVDSSGTYYVFAGGKAFGIPGPIKLQTVQAADSATVLGGTVTSTMTGATMAQGVLITTAGTTYVSYAASSGTTLFPFKGQTQLANDGYGGTAAIPAPNVGGIGIVSTYSPN